MLVDGLEMCDDFRLVDEKVSILTEIVSTILVVSGRAKEKICMCDFSFLTLYFPLTVYCLL